MKKRMLSLLLALVMLLGLLPTAAFAAPALDAGVDERVEIPVLDAPADRLSVPAADLAVDGGRLTFTPADEVPELPPEEGENTSATLSAVAGSPTIALDLIHAHAHHGDNWNDGFTPMEGESRLASYDGGTVKVDGLSIYTKERDRFKNADYLYIPFTLSATVPAHSVITYDFTVQLWHKRNSKGGVHYWVELLDGQPLNSYLKTQDSSTKSAKSLGRLCHSNKDGGSMWFSWSVTFDNYEGGSTRTIQRSMAYYVGASKSTSALNGYHHQVESSVSMTVTNVSTRKRVKYDLNNGVNYTVHYFFDDSTTTKDGPTKVGYTFDGWQDVDNTSKVYQPRQTISSGLDLKAQWKRLRPKVYYDYNGGTGSLPYAAINWGDPYGTPPTATRPGYDLMGWYTAKSGGSKVEPTTKVQNGNDHTLYARWSVKTPIVTFNANGGSVSTSTKKVTYNTAYGTLPNPARTGYTFDGWYTAQTGGDKVDSSTTVANGNAHTLYAHWIVKTPTVTFDPNGGSALSDSDKTKTVTYGGTYGTLPTPTRQNYTFTGWYTSASGGSQVTNSTKVQSASAHTLYARWSRNAYTITFQSDGKTVETRKVNAGDKLGTLPAPAKTGYTLMGWGDGVSKDTVPTANATYTARWRANTYAVTFDVGGGTLTGDKSRTVTYNSTYGSLPTPTRTGYTFDGWYNAPTNGGKVEANDVVTTASNHTLYARWAAISYTITVNGESKSVTADQTYADILPADPTKTGYTFQYWEDEKGNRIVPSAPIDPEHLPTAISPVWKANTYTVTFELNGGNALADSDKTKTVTFGQPYGVLPVPTHPEGKVFRAWYDAAGGGNHRDASSLVKKASDHTLYARWETDHTHSLGSAGSGDKKFSALGQTADPSNSVTAAGDALGTTISAYTNYFLTEDVTVSGVTTIPSGVTLNLCLNGHTLTHNGTAGSIFVVEDGGTLNICDCNGSHGSNPITSPVTNESVIIQGGLITGGNIGSGSTNSGGVVLVKSGGTFNLYSGFIGGNDITSGGSGQDEKAGYGAVRVEGTFNMYGGEICHNKYGCGGGLNIFHGTVYLHGGSISYNYASNDDGGGICLDQGTLNIEGGSITDNRAKTGGGGIHNYNGTLNLSGSPKIQNNTVGESASAKTPSNLRLESGITLGTIADGFAPAKAIGISSTATPTADSPVAVGTEGSGAYARYFVADTAGQEVIDSSGVLSLALHKHKVNPAAGGFADFTALTADTINNGTEEKTYALPAGNYYLSQDITAEKAISVASGTVQLCLNGHKIETAKSSYISVKSGATLNICDCRGGGGIVCNSNSSGAYNIYNSGTVNLYSGAVSGAQYGIYSEGGTVNVYGGTITGSNGSSAGIYSCGSGTVNVYGGTIAGNSGISALGTTTATITGGSITGNQYGINSSNGTVNVSGGSIAGGDSGIYTSKATSTVTVEGGTITGGAYGINAYGITLSGSPTVTGKTADIYASAPIQIPAGVELEGQFRVASVSSPTETDPVDVTAVVARDYSAHFVAANADEGVWNVEDKHYEDHHTVQLYKKHFHDGEEEGFTPIPTTGAWVEEENTTLTSGRYFLTGSTQANTGVLTVPEGATVDLCLNGQQLIDTQLQVDGTLNLYDCKDGSGISASVSPIVVGKTGVLNYYSGELTSTGDEPPIFANGEVHLYATPDISPSGNSRYEYELRGNTPGFLHIEAPLTQPELPLLRVNFGLNEAVNITKNRQVTVTTGWAQHMGEAEVSDYFAPGKDRHAKVEKTDGGELILRLYQITQIDPENDDQVVAVHYPDYTTGQLPSGALPEPDPRPGKIFTGWSLQHGESSVAVHDGYEFNDDGIVFPYWIQCSHRDNKNEVTTVLATCTTAGSKSYTCSVCGLEVVEELKARNHDFSTEWTEDPDNGTHYHLCAREGCDQRADEAEHTWAETGTVTQPTAENDGVMTYSCTACSATTTVVLPKLVTHTVTYTVDGYTVGDVPTQDPVLKGETVTLPADGLTRTGYTLAGWALLDEEGVPGTEVLTGAFPMPDRDVELQVRWERLPNYELQPGETIVLEDGTVIKNETDNTVTIDQNGDGTPETTITLPGGGSVTIQEGQDGGKDKVVVPPGAEVTTTPGDGGQGPVITIGDGDGKVDPSGKVDAPVGTTITDKDGNTITIAEGEGGTIDPDGVVTFPEGGGGKVTVTDKDGNQTEVAVPGGGDGLDVTPGGVPLVNNPDGSLTIPDGQGGSTTVTVPELPADDNGNVDINQDGSDAGAVLDDAGNLILPGGSTVTKTDGEGNSTETTVPDQGGAVTPGGDVGPRRPDRELFNVTDIDPEHIAGSIAISADADKMEWRRVTDPESDWQDVSDTTTATLDGLDEGYYQFRYKAEGELDASLPREIRVRDLSETGGFALTIAPGITGGTVSAVRTHVAAGFEVRLTVKAAQDYRLASITVTYEGGEPITPVWSVNTLTYNFTMPNADATVTATFVSTLPPPHEHAWSDDWTTSGTHHWHECQGEGLCGVTEDSEKRGYGAHVYDNDQDKTCNTCGYTRDVVEPGPETFTVTFDAQGGSLVGSQTVAQGKLLAKPATPTKEGFTFSGWVTEENGSILWKFSADAVTANMTLYATWTAQTAGTVVTPGSPVDVPGGGTVAKDPDTGDVTITPPEGEGGTATTITPPEEGGDVTVDPDSGEVTVPPGSAVDPGNGVKVELPDGGKVDSEGNITLSDGGEAVTVPDGEGGSATITAPDGGGTIKPTEDGKVEIPGGSTVTIPDGKGGETEITVGDEGGKVSGDGGAVTVPGGSTVTIPDGEGGNTGVTVPEGGESDIIPAGGGKVEVPGGSTVTKPDGSTVTVPSGGGIVDPATGNVTPVKPTTPSRPGGSASNKPSVSTSGQGGKVEADRDGNVTITPDKGYEIDKITVNGQEVAVPADGKLTGLKRTDKVVVTFKEVPAVTVDQFTDVKPADWFYGSVKDIVERGLMNGTGETTFAPGLTTSRAMIATIIWRLAGSPEPKAELTYPDCAKDSWYAKAVAWASEQGVVKGYGDGNFGPEDPITREQLAVMLWRYAGSPAAHGTLDSFSDSDKAGSWATDALRWAVEEGILQGKGGSVLDPAGRATRAEAAAMLTRFRQGEK